MDRERGRQRERETLYIFYMELGNYAPHAPRAIKTTQTRAFYGVYKSKNYAPTIHPNIHPDTPHPEHPGGAVQDPERRPAAALDPERQELPGSRS
jgi:hypothetical protein